MSAETWDLIAVVCLAAVAWTVKARFDDHEKRIKKLEEPGAGRES